MANTLAKASITPSDNGYQLLLEDDQGGNFEVIASFEQLDILSEEINRCLDQDEEEELSVDEPE